MPLFSLHVFYISAFFSFVSVIFFSFYAALKFLATKPYLYPYIFCFSVLHEALGIGHGVFIFCYFRLVLTTSIVWIYFWIYFWKRLVHRRGQRSFDIDLYH